MSPPANTVGDQGKLPFEACRGPGPYVFASYAHEDKVRVFSELRQLHEEGFLIWYDTGLHAGTSWSEEIAQALYNSACVLVFLSPNAVKSQNVKNEVVFAHQYQKRILPVILEPTDLPRGLELLLTDTQMLPAYSQEAHSFRSRLAAALRDAIPVMSLRSSAATRDAKRLARLDRELAHMVHLELRIAPSLGIIADLLRPRAAFLRDKQACTPGASVFGISPAEEKRGDNVFEVLRRERRFLLLGEGGAGKTTLLKLVEQSCLRYREHALRPVFVSLRFYRGDLRALILKELEREVWEQVQAESSSRTALFLLDGLNEIPQPGGADLQTSLDSFYQDLSDLIQDLPYCHLVLTCRTQDVDRYATSDALKDLSRYMVLPLTELGMKKVVISKVKPRSRAFELLHEALGRFGDALRNPQILQFVVDLYATGSRPRTRADVFGEIVHRAIVRTREIQRTPAPRELEPRLRLVLEEAATLMLDRSMLDVRFEELRCTFAERLGLSAPELHAALDEACTDGLLGWDASRGFFFSHQSLQEYFAASYLKRRPPEEWKARGRLHAWREPMIYLAETLPDPREVLEIVCVANDADLVARVAELASPLSKADFFRFLSLVPRPRDAEVADDQCWAIIAALWMHSSRDIGPDELRNHPWFKNRWLIHTEFSESGNHTYERGDFNLATACYDLALLFGEDVSNALHNRGLSRYNLEDYPRAAADYQRVAAIDPSNPIIFNHWGDALFRQAKFEEAIELYDRALELNPNYMMAFYNRGLAKACLERYDTAVEDFNKVVSLAPDFAEVYCIRGLAYHYATRPEAARADYEKALELDPRHPQARAYLIQVSGGLGTGPRERRSITNVLERRIEPTTAHVAARELCAEMSAGLSRADEPGYDLVVLEDAVELAVALADIYRADIEALQEEDEDLLTRLVDLPRQYLEALLRFPSNEHVALADRLADRLENLSNESERKESLCRLAEAYSGADRGRTDRYIQLLEGLWRIPEDAVLIARVAHLHQDGYENETARRYADLAFKADPTHPSVLRTALRVAAAGPHPEQVQWIVQASGKLPEEDLDFDCVLHLARGTWMRDPAGAERILDRVSDRFGEEASFWEMRGEIATDDRRYDDARNYLIEAEKHLGDDPGQLANIWHSRGYLAVGCRDRKMLEEAIAECRHLEPEEESDIAYFEVFSRVLQGDMAGARDVCERSRQIQTPGYNEASDLMLAGLLAGKTRPCPEIPPRPANQREGITVMTRWRLLRALGLIATTGRIDEQSWEEVFCDGALVVADIPWDLLDEAFRDRQRYPEAAIGDELSRRLAEAVRRVGPVSKR